MSILQVLLGQLRIKKRLLHGGAESVPGLIGCAPVPIGYALGPKGYVPGLKGYVPGLKGYVPWLVFPANT